MHKKKALFITFEGIEGSGKSYLIKRIYKSLKNKRISTLLTREPGGTKTAEKIRDLILEDYFYHDSKEKFDKYTDTLLYLASRNEHLERVIKPAIANKKVILCDRFIDSTIAYQVYGKGVNKKFVDIIHKYILGNVKANLTFLLKVDIHKSSQRLKKRRKKNRYDKFSKSFYTKAQNAFIKIAKKNKKRYLIVNNSNDSRDAEKIILKKILKSLEK